MRLFEIYELIKVLITIKYRFELKNVSENILLSSQFNYKLVKLGKNSRKIDSKVIFWSILLFVSTYSSWSLNINHKNWA